VIDRPGIEARITPWLAWLERVQGLVYYSTTDWSPDPWSDPWTNAGNGDGLLFYPPKDTSIAFDASNPQSNRLVPSIRWELLREGMEDYEYLWLLNQGDPQIGTLNSADNLAGEFISSRTLFSRVPTDLYAARAAIAAELTGPSAGKTASSPAVRVGDPYDFILTYRAGNTPQMLTISDLLPPQALILTAAANKGGPAQVAGQQVTWEGSLAAREEVTLTITVRSSTTGLVTNTASFSGPETLSASAGVFIYSEQLFLPMLRR
jgi:hypothetical protein